MKKIIPFIILLLAQSSFGLDLNNYKIIDLSHPFDEKTIYWPTAETFQSEVDFEGETPKGYFYAAKRFCSAEHGGTHLDAPFHFYKKGETVEKITLKNLMGQAIVIDISKKALKNPDYLISVEDIQNWENQNGVIKKDQIILLKTGYGKFWPDRKKYLGTDERGQEAVKKLHFPSISPEASDWLIKNRKIKAIGIDTASIDYGQSKLFESHRILAKAGVAIFENVMNLDQLPIQDFNIIALPMKISGGTGAPVRIIALVDH